MNQYESLNGLPCVMFFHLKEPSLHFFLSVYSVQYLCSNGKHEKTKKKRKKSRLFLKIVQKYHL